MAENTEQEIQITDKVWKVSMNTGGTQDNPITTKATLHSLFELLAWENNGEVGLYADADKAADSGAKLGHDIILFNNEVYDTISGAPKNDPTSSLAWQKYYGIDLRCPQYDSRARLNGYKKEITSIGKQDEYQFNIGGTYYVFNKAGALLPRNVTEFHFDNDDAVNNNVWPLLQGQGEQEETDITNRVLNLSANCVFTVGTDAYNNNDTFDIILARQDKVFHSSIVFSESKETYTRMYLNCTSKVAQFVAHCLLKHCDKLTDNGGNFIDIITECGSQPVDFLRSIISNLDTRFLLKHIYVWVRAPYAGDYVRPEDFDQNLNKDSTVIHKNLYLRKNNGDLNRYNETDVSLTKQLANENNEEINTRAYIPNNAPLKDYITPEIIKPLKNNNENKSELSLLEENCSNPESEIGSIFTASKDKTIQTTLTRPNFFDPELSHSKELDREYYSYEDKTPSVIPKDGNLVVDSRILSPSIDELWYTLKKMIFGRNEDSEILNNRKESDLPKSYCNIDLSQNDKDTTLKEAEKINFLFKYYPKNGDKPIKKIGDPVEFEDKEVTLLGSDSKGIETYATEFFSNPNSIVYIDYENLCRDFERINNWKREKVNTEETPNFINVKVSDAIKCDGEQPYHTTNNSPEFISNYKAWFPRSSPLSLRELEARTLGNKYALVKAVKHIATNFVVAGSLGVFETKNNSSLEIMGGSLYQLHKEYNLVPENPNSMFRRYSDGKRYYGDNGEIEPTSGIDAVFSDSQSNEIDIITNHSTIDSDTDTTNMRFSHMPKLVDNYGTSDYIEEESGDYSGADVYLSALGDWRYIGEHVRVPILRSRY